MYMQHPDVRAVPAEVTPEAFDAVWKDKGWQVVADVDALAEIVTEGDVSSAKALGRLKHAELVERAAALGLGDLTESTREQIAERILASQLPAVI